MSNLKLGQENPPADEAAVTQEMLDVMAGGSQKPSGPNGSAIRQAHTFMHGCVKATFTVDANLPEAFKVGILKNETSFPAYIRFSNASNIPVKTTDPTPDVRGFAIKLMNVPGEKMLESEKNEQTQDLIMMTSPVFSAKTVAEFLGVVKAVYNPDPAVQGAYFGNPANGEFLGRVNAANGVHRHLLEETYFSATPYKFGSDDKAIKFKVSPSEKKSYDVVSTTADNYLRQNLVKTLGEEAVSFDFFIQFQKDVDSEPIEDSTVEWKTDFTKVATITIPVQEFDTDEQNKFGEKLSMTPWHTLPEHQPLGGINRARKPIYEALSALRHRQNGASNTEPTS